MESVELCMMFRFYGGGGYTQSLGDCPIGKGKIQLQGVSNPDTSQYVVSLVTFPDGDYRTRDTKIGHHPCSKTQK